MALRFLNPISSACCSSKLLHPKHCMPLPRAATSAYCKTDLRIPAIVRRTANYQPTIWDYDYVQSLTSNFVGEKYTRKANELKEKVRVMLDDKVKNPLASLQLIDLLQRLGISYHFEGEISEIMQIIYIDYTYVRSKNVHESLLFKSLVFRLLRQHGYNIPQEIFDDFKDETGNIKESVFEDIEGMLNLYEASFLSVEGETLMDNIKNFTVKHLREKRETNPSDHYISALVSHSLELPLHWRVPRLEARWFIDVYEICHDMNPLILEFAKLDFNMVQAIHQEDLKYASRWDINEIEAFPDYMKICYLAFYNSINEISYESLIKHGVFILTYVKKAWVDICNSYLVEANWYHRGHIPTLEEYMENAWISISAPVILVHAYFLTTDDITDEGLQCLNMYPNIVGYSAMILRLADDLGTSTDELERGDTPKSIQCYMHEYGASEEEAREYIKYLIGQTWKKMNKERLMDSPFTQTFIETTMNLGRMAQCMYQHGDGHGSQNSITRARVFSLITDNTHVDDNSQWHSHVNNEEVKGN